MASEIEEGSDGLYALCVFYAENSSDDELREIFEKFGPVVIIHRVKNTTFIRYRNLDEAVKCYEAMQNHPKFRVKPGRKKPNAENGNQRRNEMNRRSNEGKDFHSGSRNDGRDYNNRNESDLDRRNSGQKPNNWGNDTRRTNPQPAMPKLVPKHPASAVEQGSGITQKVAREVIIGNIPHDLKQCNIYELCTKANGPPLHVEMKSASRPQEPIMYYAHVYVKNDKDAKNITDGLNNLIVNGYQLIACSVEKLTEEAREISMSRKQ